ncbi:hypothetical protein SmJEL517_g05325 [Synchytrium microbalum]|uniref:Nitrogen permease regulator 3 n=1 Tax=Synchytrium microbalum TaxID=1806994 RepID=A0A507BWM8_9FUNG|nr:uncharacterized protein SmJEL517_g05325 [Synchytrium microbalum]TPX31289.1 hypothetical protein SmJEL517_g05325 [Synchytrium microbalum]
MSVSALLLAVRDNTLTGHQLLFSYPAVPERKNAPRSRPRAASTSTGKANNRNNHKSNKRSNEDEGILGFDVDFLSSVLSPKASLCDAKLEISVDMVTFVAQSTLLTSGGVSHESSSNINQDDVSAASVSDGEASPNETRLTMFTLAFAMEADDPMSFGRQVAAAHRVISKVAMALKEEQLKNDYVLHEMEIILGIRETFDDNPEEQVKEMIKKSSLAKALADVYTSYTSSDASSYPPQGLRPYHALLLLHDPEEILADLPPPGVLQSLYPRELANLIPLVTPTQSFAELSDKSRYSMEVLYLLAGHLIFWRKARIIDAINLKNIYVLSSQAGMDANLFKESRARFPRLDVLKFLSDLSFPRPLSQVVPAKEQQAMHLELVTYLLRRGLLRQLHLYLNLLPSSQDINRSDYARMIARTLRPSFIPMFEQLVHYMDGKHHLEEVVFLESLSRRDIKKFLAAVPEVITILH